MLVVTGQGEGAADSVGGDKLLKQRGGKLDVLTGGAFGDYVAGGAAIIVQILIGGEAQVKLVSFHGIILCPAKPQLRGKARMLVGRWFAFFVIRLSRGRMTKKVDFFGSLPRVAAASSLTLGYYLSPLRGFGMEGDFSSMNPGGWELN